MFQSKIKQCQNCKNDFAIAPEDFEFYQKIDVPEPTFCPECRLQRRMAWRKEAPFFYKSKCQATGKDVVTVYHPKSPIKIFEQKAWHADNWDIMTYGRDYDFNRTFFEQFYELMGSAPFPAAINEDAVNSDFCFACIWIKDSYLTTNSGKAENLLYCNRTVGCKDSADLYICTDLELCYQNIYCFNSYKLFFSSHCDSCMESAFLHHCRNCEHCFGCTNLRNKKFYIFNQPYSKEKYYSKIKELDLGSYAKLVREKAKFKDLCLKSIHKFANIVKSVDVSGDEIKNSKNCHYVFDASGCENTKFVNWAGFGFPVKDTYDCGPGIGLVELLYEAVDDGNQAVRNLFCLSTVLCRNIEYCVNVYNCKNLFGCVGLRSKEYCILNRQYAKEEYEELVKKIKEQMGRLPYTDKQGRVYKYGEFFPAELSPFGYQETVANEHFPLEEDEIKEQGYVFYGKASGQYVATVKAGGLPDHIKEVQDQILDEVIECANGQAGCLGSGVFKIIASELAFYRKLNLSLPRLCPNCRHREKVSQRNPLRLYRRQCMNLSAGEAGKPCPNTFQTTYAPDRPEIVYCEECYQKEVE